MAYRFRAETFQNEFLPAGTGEVHAIMTVTAGDAAGSPAAAAAGGAAADAANAAGAASRVFGVICDVSGSMEGGKIAAARGAMAKLVELLPPDSSFFLIAGADDGQVICPLTAANYAGKQRAYAAIREMHAFGGTHMSRWLGAALDQFLAAGGGGVRQALLLTDGQNDQHDVPLLGTVLARCEGVFQCDCRGVGTDWQVAQLRAVAGKLLGTVDIILSPQQIEADFHALLSKAMDKTVSDVFLRLWTPQGARVKFCKEVSPEIVDLTGRAREVKPQLREYPTGSWARAEQRDYHFCIEVTPGAVGDEVLAGRASLVVSERGAEDKVAEARILAVWTDDEAKSTKIDRTVAHYTGQAELAASIQQGIEARDRGDTQRATVLLGKAVKLANDSGNEATARLLRRVVDVEDADTGTVRLKQAVSKEDSMALDTRSTKTARIVKTP